jgi:hypothetical protein
MGKFDDIMNLVSPKPFIAHTEVPHDNARESFVQPNSIVASHEEFQGVLIAYVTHHMDLLFGSHPPPEFCLIKARDFLESSDGYDNAVFIAMSGTKGGINYVLNLINEQFKAEAKQAYFTYVMNEYVDPLNFDDITDLMREFKQKLGGYAPNAFNFITPESMASNYRQIIWNYIESLTNYRNLWSF